MEFSISNSNQNAVVTLQERPYAGHDNVTLLDVDVTFSEPTVPTDLRIGWRIPCIDIYSTSCATEMYRRDLTANWCCRKTDSRLASGAPLHQLVSVGGENRLCIALSDAKTPCRIASGVVERTSEIDCFVTFFTEPINTITEYHATVYLDFSRRRYDLSLKAADLFWQQECGYPCARIPEGAREPVYSTWYSFHHHINVDEIVSQCEQAAEYGMKTVIVDDGWQCESVSGGYSYCGDWEVCNTKVPDMKEFVDRVHKTGLKFVLWYSVPAVGIHSKAYQRFSDMLLNPSAPYGWSALDPRFPAVREYLTGIYEKAVREWGLDGLKLDFIDSFELGSETPAFDPRWDTLSLEDAVDRLLDGITKALHAINPDILIEFRQSYFGPVIRKYGNMIRVGDCPNDSIRNHVGGIDLRYMLGSTPVHSDMLMWNYDDTVESAAHQVICTMFTVPQISVKLEKLSQEHRDMLRFYLHFWREHKTTLLDGDLLAENPEATYSIVRAEKDGELVAVAFAKPVLNVESCQKLFFLNASGDDFLIVRFTKDLGKKHVRIFDCMGHVLEEKESLCCGTADFPVPACGMLEIL